MYKGNIPIKRAVINASTSGAGNTIIAAVENKKIRVLNYMIIAAGTVTVTWFSDTDALSGALPFVVNTGAMADSDNGVLETGVGKALKMTLSGAVAVTGHISYVEV